ncbi:MAG: Glutamyl-tRNA(Gln) amidotransferase subunit C [Alphaproteobacteria bacterium MarineAlpha9_Bin4]|nr:MAG: Glutamyl-tRNA(Gln) amidotransferase subunit C [Alphaproteobacteria bacterium MarineAlpha9_Bin4]|tara:strand:+ start:130 stop:420 length:291 start_codon:yes stop_codon:yes gene_type:complete
MLIDKKITKKIAFLARIELNDKEEEEFSKDLSNILQWMEDLKKVDVKNIEPIRNVNDSQLFEREDLDFSKTIDQDQILSNAPKKNGKFFTVPKVIE